MEKITGLDFKIKEMAARIKALREIESLSVAEMAIKTEIIGGKVAEIDNYLSDKHYFRKHGKDAYYGQK